MKMTAHLKLPSRSTVRLACTRYSNESDPTLRRPPRGREGGRALLRPHAASSFTFGFLTRFGAGESGGGRNEMGSLASRRSEINLSRNFRSSSPSTDQSVDPEFESNSMSFVLPPSPPNTDLLDALSPPLSLSLKRRSLTRCSLPPSAARERISDHSGSRPAENP